MSSATTNATKPRRENDGAETPEMLHVQCEHEVKSCDFFRNTKQQNLPPYPLINLWLWVGGEKKFHSRKCECPTLEPKFRGN